MKNYMASFILIAYKSFLLYKGLDFMSINKSEYKEFTNISEAEQWGIFHYGEWASIYNKNMDAARSVLGSSYDAPIEYYCGNVYDHINNYLRFGLDSTESSTYTILSKLLALSLVNAPRIPENIVVYRLVSDCFIDDLLDRGKEGIPAIENGFISACLLEDITKSTEHYSTRKHLLKIYVKKGTIGIYVSCVEHANRSHEQEMLLFPYGFFRILDGPYRKSGKKVYECELFYF